jgi:peptide/nickel transport system substrate-binding protein
MMTADEYLYVPIHHQMRPWAMKKNISTHHKSDDRAETRFVRID